ncbi:MAG TPA: carboxypeptidase-like regulatory domain-containing protein [Terriglobales bacterium]
MRRALKFLPVVALLLALPVMAKDKPTSHLEFLVVRSNNGKPVRNASVVLHSVNKEGKQSKDGLQLKTNREGKAELDGIPYGTMRIQAIAQGLQTYGQDIEIDQPSHQITIKMNQPQEQYSIYK